MLAAEEERALARAIEAGLFAAACLQGGQRPVPASDTELALLAEAGERAWHRFLLANLRLVWKLAGREARRTGLPVEELFQEGFVALAGALQRYDHERGRFSTFATIRVRQHLAEVASARFGEVALPPSRALRMRRALGLEAALAQERGGAVAASEVAAHLGRPTASAHRLLRHRPPVSLAEVAQDEAIPDPEPVDFERDLYHRQVHRVLAGLEVEQARVLALRFGFATGEPLEVAEVAHRLGVSVSTVQRRERRALAALRALAPALDPWRQDPLAG